MEHTDPCIVVIKGPGGQVAWNSHLIMQLWECIKICDIKYVQFRKVSLVVYMNKEMVEVKIPITIVSVQNYKKGIEIICSLWVLVIKEKYVK